MTAPDFTPLYAQVQGLSDLPAKATLPEDLLFKR